MGKGAKPKPAKLKLLIGNPGKRAIKETAKAESSIPQVKPDFPAHLFTSTKKENSHTVKKGKEQWGYIVEKLFPLGLITVLDVPILEKYIINYVYWLQAIEAVNKDGFSITSGDAIKKNPAFSVFESVHKFQKEFLIEFGMTPAARSKIQMAGTGEVEDPLEAMLRKKAGKRKPA